MNSLRRMNRMLGKAEYILISGSVLAMAAVLISNSIGRTVFKHSFKSAEEISQFLILIVTYIGLSNAARYGKHVVMSAVYDAMPPRGKKIMSIAISGLTGAFLVLLAYLSFSYTLKVYEYGRITSALGVPMWIVTAVVPIGCVLAALQYIFTAVLNVTDRDGLYSGSELEEERRSRV